MKNFNKGLNKDEEQKPSSNEYLMAKNVDQFMPIVEMRKLIEDIFANYKRYWENEVPDWNYEIREIDIHQEYIIEIRCGRSIKVCILRQSAFISDDLEFAPRAYAKLNVWLRLIREIGTAGAVKLYQDTVTLYREKRIESMGVPYGENPLTITEAYQTK